MKTDADNPGMVITYVLVGFCLIVVMGLIWGFPHDRPRTPAQRIYDYQVEHRLPHGSPPPDDGCVTAYPDDDAGFEKCEENSRKAKCAFMPNSPGCPAPTAPEKVDEFSGKAKSRPNAVSI